VHHSRAGLQLQSAQQHSSWRSNCIWIN